MGNGISLSRPQTTLSFHNCLVNGEIYLHRCWIHKCLLGSNTNASYVFDSIIEKERIRNNDESSRSEDRLSRSVQKHKLLYRDDNGDVKEFKTSHILWYFLYVIQESKNVYQRNFLSTRIRMPHTSFLDLKIFLSMRYLNDGYQVMFLIKNQVRSKYVYCGHFVIWEEDEPLMTFKRILVFHESTIANFLMYVYSMEAPYYIISVLPHLYWTLIYRNSKNFLPLLDIMIVLGFSERSPFYMLLYASWALINYLGSKLNIPSRTYNITVTYCRKIFGATCGNPATWDDKSIILYNDLVRGVHAGKLFNDHEFTLLEYDVSGNII